MDPNNLPKNSSPAQPTAPQVPRVPKTAVVTGAKVIPPKDSLGKKLKKTFINDNIDLKGYIINNILIPTVQGTFFSIVMNSISMIFKRPNAGMGGYYQPPMMGTGWPPMSSNPYGIYANPNQSINYGQYARPFQQMPTPTNTLQQTVPMIKPTDIQIPTKELAESAIVQMQDTIQSNGKLTMLEFFQILSVKGNGYTDDYWGWTDLRGVEPKPHYAGGYYIDMPRAVSLPPRI